ncbi:hypothetical protein A8924_6331 [Saccharopolyspora erythraea NRRL 2338]|uniref:Uncharacterized protein n=2 Tax=Saccharopolyspora erythraea TaxID=1836 RepID=A4FM93_SACEN|nr:hypothetical protein [Saccharopolyspora erythraea]EQD87814.1 hypothetical protein N599_02405 [Saccharopolyspora erythraea D]PFG98805.1 hypothetical protein A8924_6331 [Saccharopolyspora erythraea NRRL 2338]QRK88803.1 hypothetical protein JQX30_29990 [Saccharopolyspora erythraea]CAM05168.1 hypothetical protein SACE_5988 [Saccharopolyspora erythraea NRRL 2338]
MSTHSGLAPGKNATVVRYRYGWGMLAGALGLLAFAGIFVFYLLTPGQAAREFNPFVPWVMIILVGPIALLFLAGSLFVLSRTHRVHVDERGMWFSSWNETDLIAWTELRAVRAREPRPKPKDDPKADSLPAALELHPGDANFAQCHAKLVKTTDSGLCTVDLPGRATVRRLAQAISKYRPDLLR